MVQMVEKEAPPSTRIRLVVSDVQCCRAVNGYLICHSQIAGLVQGGSDHYVANTAACCHAGLLVVTDSHRRGTVYRRLICQSQGASLVQRGCDPYVAGQRRKRNRHRCSRRCKPVIIASYTVEI